MEDIFFVTVTVIFFLGSKLYDENIIINLNEKFIKILCGYFPIFIWVGFYDKK
jgi:hypothetical protein